MAEPHHPPPPCGEAGPLARDTRLAALTGNSGMKALPATASRRLLPITRLEADG